MSEQKRKKKIKKEIPLVIGATILLVIVWAILLKPDTNLGAKTNDNNPQTTVASVEEYPTWNKNDQSLYVASDVDRIRQKYEARESFVLVVAESNDAQSQEIIPIINDLATRYAFDSVEYINRADAGGEVLNKLSEIAEMYKTPGLENTKVTLPSVVFVRNGDTVYVHNGTVPGYNPLDRTMTEAESDELYKVFASGFDVVTGQAETMYTLDQSNYATLASEEETPESTDAEISEETWESAPVEESPQEWVEPTQEYTEEYQGETW